MGKHGKTKRDMALRFRAAPKKEITAVIVAAFTPRKKKKYQKQRDLAQGSQLKELPQTQQEQLFRKKEALARERKKEALAARRTTVLSA